MYTNETDYLSTILRHLLAKLPKSSAKPVPTSSVSNNNVTFTRSLGRVSARLE